MPERNEHVQYESSNTEVKSNSKLDILANTDDPV